MSTLCENCRGGSVRQAAEGVNTREASSLGGSGGMAYQNFFDILDALMRVITEQTQGHLCYSP